MQNIFTEAIGWIGSVLVLGSYILNIQGRLSSHSKKYIWANLVGGLCFAINTYAHQAYPSVALNCIWVFIAVHALFKKKKPL